MIAKIRRYIIFLQIKKESIFMRVNDNTNKAVASNFNVIKMFWKVVLIQHANK